jgi:nucleotide-binding universal stress UspA family protein
MKSKISTARNGSRSPVVQADPPPDESASSGNGNLSKSQAAGVHSCGTDGALTPHVRYILKLYREKYNGLSATAFRRVLATRHDITIPDSELRAALRAVGLFRRVGLIARSEGDRARAGPVSLGRPSVLGSPRRPGMITKILVALDGSRRAAGVFDAAGEVASSFGATLHPFRAVVVPPEFPAAAAGSPHDPLFEHLVTEANADLVRLAARAPLLAVEAPVVRVGQPWRLILEVADELDVDLIVLGSHGYHGLDRILGTTAGRVVNFSHRNVLVVHERPDPAGASSDSTSGSPSASRGPRGRA